MDENPKKYSKHFIAKLLNISRKTFYDRIINNDFKDDEIKILKDNKIII